MRDIDKIMEMETQRKKTQRRGDTLQRPFRQLDYAMMMKNTAQLYMFNVQQDMLLQLLKATLHPPISSSQNL